VKKFYYSFLLLALFIGISSASAKVDIVGDFGANYGGSDNDRFYSLDWFSDGSYVAVGSTKSSFGTITNSGEEDGLVVIYDKNNNVKKEFTWVSEDTNKSERFYEVKVIDDQSFLACGDATLEGYCVKFKTDGSVVWTRKIGNVSTTNKYSIYKLNNGNFLISNDNVLSRYYILKSTGEIESNVTIGDNQYSGGKITEFVAFNNNIIGVGQSNVTGNTSLFKISNTGELLDTKVFSSDTSSIIDDVDVLDNNLLLSIETGVCNNNCVDVFGNNHNSSGALAIVDPSYNIVKSADLGLAGVSKIVTNIVDDYIVVTANSGDGIHSYLMYFDKSLNLVKKNEYKFEDRSHFSFEDSKINPLNKNVYIVGYIAKEYGTIRNNGGIDAFVMSAHPVVTNESNQSNGSSVVNPSNDTSSENKTEVKEEKKEPIENPETGAFVNTLFVIGLATILAVVVINIRNKKKLFRL